jgi:hypothetical protein
MRPEEDVTEVVRSWRAAIKNKMQVIGSWLAQNGEAIYEAGPGLALGAYYGPSTGKPVALYLHVASYPADGVIRVRGLERRVSQVTLLATAAPLEFDQQACWSKACCASACRAA